MSKIVTDKLQKSGGQELTLPSALATANNQPLIGATNGQLSFSASALPSALATANNQPIVGQTTGVLNFLPYAMPAADGSTGQFVKTDGSGNLSFGTVSVPAASIKSASDPDATVAQGELGDFFVNTTSGESFICTFVGTGTTKRRWAGQLGTNIGYPQGQAIFYDGVNLPNGSDQPPSADFQTTFTCPAGVAQIHVVLVGGGGGGEPQWAGSSGGGGALAWANEIAVTAGTVYYLEVGTGGRHQTAGGHTTLRTGSHTGTIIFQAQGGQTNVTNFANIAKPVAGTVTPGNNTSGRGGMSSQNGYGGGGGAGGYTGNGGNGYYGHNSTGQPNNTLNDSIDGTGGAASGGAGYQSSTYGFGGGGGVGLYGEGTSGTYNDQNSNSHQTHPYHEGIGGSGGEDGHTNNNATTSNGSSRTNTFGYGTANDESNMVTTTGSGTPTGSRNVAHGQGGMFGGGGGGGGTSNSNNAAFCNGGLGGARILWGKGRAFPATLTGNVTTVAG